MKIGLIHEGKVPPDRRVALTPEQCKIFSTAHSDIKIVVQSSPTRVFSDDSYRKQGIQVQDKVGDCDILLGIKEVLVEDLIPNKTYLFFSHTIKKQAYNKVLLRELVNWKITLIDYEVLVNGHGNRIIGFGRYAGLIGAYNALRALALKEGLQMLRPAYKLSGLNEMLKEATKLQLPPIKIAFTGRGRVAKGVKEILDYVGVKQVSVEDYLSKKSFKKAVYVQLGPEDYNESITSSTFNLQRFFTTPQEFTGSFNKFYHTTDLLISSAYWNPNAPVLFTENDMQKNDFKIKLIADITCDVKGSIPSTIRASTIKEPFYDYNPYTKKEEEAFTGSNNITVMAVDNLPNELPRDASEMFGNVLISDVLPLLIEGKENKMIRDATIVKKGEITLKYSDLKSWLGIG